MKPSFATCTRARAVTTASVVELRAGYGYISLRNGRPRKAAAGARPNIPASIPAARGGRRLVLLRRAGRGPVQPRRGSGRRGRVRAVRLLQGRRQPRRANGRRGPAGGRGRQVLRVAAGGEGRVRPRRPARVREQAHRPQWRHGVARVPPPRPRRRPRPRRLVVGVQGVPCPVILVAAERGEPVRGRRAGRGDVGAGGAGGGAGRGAEGRAERHGGGRGERPGVPDQPLPGVPAAATAPAGLVRRHGIRRAHGPAAGVRAAFQRHGRPAGRAPRRRRRAVGARAARPRRLLRHRRRLAAGADEWEAEKCAAPGGGGQQPEGAGVHDLLRGTGAGAADGAIAAAAGARRAELVQGLHMGRLQEGCLPIAPRRQPPGPLPPHPAIATHTAPLSRDGWFLHADASAIHRPQQLCSLGGL